MNNLHRFGGKKRRQLPTILTLLIIISLLLPVVPSTEQFTQVNLTQETQSLDHTIQPLQTPPLQETTTPPEEQLWINVTKELSKNNIHPCEPTTIHINVSVEGNATTSYAPLNVYLVLDRSGSMDECYDGHTALYWTKEAAKSFVEELNFSKDKVGIISYATQVTIEQPLTNNLTAAIAAINGITIKTNNWERGTNTGDAIRVAQEQLQENIPDGSIPVMVLFTDGCPTIHGLSQDIHSGNVYDHFCGNCPTDNNTCVLSARNQATQAKANGTTIFTAGFFDVICETCSPPDYNCTEVTEYAEWLLHDIASEPEYFFNALNVSDILDIFLAISQQAGEIVLSNLAINDFLPPEIIVLDNNTGIYTAHANGTQQVTFTKTTMAINSTWNTSFTITTDQTGQDILTNLDYSHLAYNLNAIPQTKLLPYPLYLDSTNSLSLDKQGPTQVIQGQEINYTLTIANIGHIDLYNVTIIDILHENLTFTPTTAHIFSSYSGFNQDNWDYDALNHTIIIHDLILPIGQIITVNILVDVTETAEGSIDNEFTVYYSSEDLICDAGGFISSSITTDIELNNPNIEITKSPGYQEIIIGEDADFDIMVTNIGDVPLSNVIVSDPLCPDCDVDIGSLAVGESISYQCTAINVLENFTNTIEVTGQDPTGAPVTDNDSADVVVLYDPSIEITKSPGYQEIHIGEDADFDITVTNTGNVPLIAVSVIDPLCSDCDYYIGDLAVGESINYQCTALNVLENFTNIIEVTGMDPIGEPVSDVDSAEIVVICNPGIEITKSPSYQEILIGGNANFTITVTNTGDVDLTDVTVTDLLCPDCDTIIGDLEVGESINYQCTDYDILESYINTVEVTGMDPTGAPVTDDDTAEVVVLCNPGISITKSPEYQLVPAGTTVWFHIEVENTGNVGLAYVNVTDPSCPNCHEYIGYMAPGETYSYNCSLSNVQESFINYVEVTGIDPLEHIIQDNDTAEVEVYSPNIDVNKTADPTHTAPSTYANYTIIVENTGDCILYDVFLFDELPMDTIYISDDHNGTEDLPGLIHWNLSEMNPGEIITITVMIYITENASGTLENYVNVTGRTSTGYPVGQGDFAYIHVLSPSINVIKTVDPTQTHPSTNITYTITVENDGSCILDPVKVLDTLPSGITYISDNYNGTEVTPGIIQWEFGMSPGSIQTITLKARVNSDANGILPNIVFVSGTPPYGENVTDNDIVNITIIQPNIELIKCVKYNCNGPYTDDGIIIDLDGPHAYDWCSFRINVTNLRDVPLNITIVDIIPEGLTDGEHYKPRHPDHKDGNELHWYYDGSDEDHPLLQPGETISIELRADMGDCNVTYLNHAYVTSQAGTEEPMTDIDTAYVKWINCHTTYPIDINQSIQEHGFPIRNALDGEWGAAQSFIPGVDVITGVDLYLRKFGTPEFDLCVMIMEDHPEGTFCTAVNISSENVSTAWEWVEIDLSNVATTPGTEYFIVIPPAPSSTTNSYGYEWGLAYGDIYLDGAFWFTRDGGSLWTALPDTYEFTFKTYGYNS